jgi:hypothetical protein
MCRQQTSIQFSFRRKREMRADLDAPRMGHSDIAGLVLLHEFADAFDNVADLPSNTAVEAVSERS